MPPTMLDAALELAADDYFVFPCVEDGKEPACAHGVKDATNDPDTIRELWRSNNNYNIAISPDASGLVVVDIDVKKDGELSWCDYLKSEGLAEPQTYTVKTPGGGRHLYLLGQGRSTVDTLGRGVDTRGLGGYVLVPPSKVGGKPYVPINDATIAAAPGAILARLARRDETTTSRIDELDRPSDVARARAFLSDEVGGGRVAVSGRGGNNTTFRIAANLRDLAISPEKSLALLTEIWNPACQPPWSDDELATIVRNASKYAENEPGIHAVEPAIELWPEHIKLLLYEAEKTPKNKNRFMSVSEMANMPEPKWLIKDILMEHAPALLAGGYHTFKSFLALDFCLATSTGLPTAQGITPERQAPTIYACREGMRGIATVRRRAWCIGHGLDPDQDMPFFLGLSPLVKNQQDCDDFIDQIYEKTGGIKPAIVVLDTVKRSMAGLDETRDAGDFLLLCEAITEKLSTSPLALHHFGHNAAHGARGGTVWPDNFDTYMEVALKGGRRVELWIKKQKDAEEPRDPFTMQGRIVPPSMCFYPTTKLEHGTALKSEDPYNRAAVGTALAALKARGDEAAVASSILAQQLFPKDQDEGIEAYEDRLKKATTKLFKLSRGILSGYCIPSNAGPRWCLPATF